jgi:hypothetical protein
MDFLANELKKQVGKGSDQETERAMTNLVFDKKGKKLFNMIPVPEGLQELAATLTPRLVNFATKKTREFLDDKKPGLGQYANYVVPTLIYAKPTIDSLRNYRKEMNLFNAKLEQLFEANTAGKSGVSKLFSNGTTNNGIVNFARNQVHATYLNTLVANGIDGGVNLAYAAVVNDKRLSEKAKEFGKEIVGNDVTSLVGNTDLQPAVDLGVGALTSALNKMALSRLPQKYKDTNSLNYCLEFISAAEAAAKNFDPLDARDTERELRAQTQKVLQIFKARYKEENWGKMSERVQEKLEELIPKMVRPMLTGELSPLAIINLAGESKILQNNGQVVANDAELEDALEIEMGKLSSQRMAKITDFTAATEVKVSDIVAIWKELAPEESAFLSTVLPDRVLEKAGMKTADIAEFRKEGKKHFDVTAEAIIEDLSKRPAEEMREFFSKKEINFIRNLDHALQELQSKHRRRGDDLSELDEKDRMLQNKTVKDILAKAVIKADSPKHWAKILEEKKAERADKKEQGTAEDLKSDNVSRILAEKEAERAEKGDRLHSEEVLARRDRKEAPEGREF